MTLRGFSVRFCADSLFVSCSEKEWF
jgi:hypothetical protein